MGELRCTLKQAQEGVAVPLDETTRIIVVPAVAQVTIEGRSFDAGRTFLLPGACNPLNEVFAFAMRMQAKHSVVVAHVDEAEPAPDALSEARAKLAAAWLSGDPAPWADQYNDEVAEERRWGGREDRYLLSLALGNRSVSPRTAGETGDPRVRSFQELAGVKVDGIVGPVTRTKLVEEYFALSRTAVLSGAPRPERESDNGITLLDTQVTPLGAACNFSLQQVLDATWAK